MIKKLTSVATAVSALALSATPAFAYTNPITQCTADCDLGASNCVICLIGLVLTLILAVVAGIALIFLAIGGIQYMSSGGDKVAIEAARGKITSAVTGLVIVFGAYLLIKIICKLLGVTECGL